MTNFLFLIFALISISCVMNALGFNFDNCDDFNDQLVKRLNSTHFAVCGPNEKVTCYRRFDSAHSVDYADAPVEKFACDLYVEESKIATDNKRRNLGVFIKENTYEWPKGVLCYQVSNLFSRAHKAFIQTAVNKLNAVSNHTGASLITRDQCKPDMGVCDHCQHYVNVFPGKGCYSYVGLAKMDDGGPQELSLENGFWRNCFGNGAGTALHEFGHALGLFHEHAHPKRPVIFLPQNLQVLPRNYAVLDSSIARNTPYDKDSIMHYPLYSANTPQAGLCIPKNSSIEYCGIKKTKTCVVATPEDCDLEAGKGIGYHRDLSKGDIEALRAIYKEKGDIDSPRTNTPRTRAPSTKPPPTMAPTTAAPVKTSAPTELPTTAPVTPTTTAPIVTSPPTVVPTTTAPVKTSAPTELPTTAPVTPTTTAPISLPTVVPTTTAPVTTSAPTMTPTTTRPSTKVPGKKHCM